MTTTVNNSNPAQSAQPITPSDTTVLDDATRALFVSGAGNLTVLMMDGQQVTFTAVLAGTILPVRVTKVFQTGTTATNIVALW